MIDVDPGAGEIWQTRLARFLLRTKAEITLQPDVTMVALRGEGANERAEGAVGGVSEPGPTSGWLDAGWPGTEGRDLLVVDGQEAARVAEALVAAGACSVDAEELEARRIRAGVPAWGAELDHDTIPAAAGQWVIDRSVSFTKGCYTGQELVARVDSRGNRVPRRLEGMLVDGVAPMAGTAVTVDGEVVGQVTSSAADAATGGAVALVYVARSVTVPAEARVGDLPVRLANLPLTTGS